MKPTLVVLGLQRCGHSAPYWSMSKKLPARLPRIQHCEAPPWPTDPVIVVDARRASVPHRLAAGAALYVANKVFYVNP
jgi:hypothetical protein